jgi:hypothetical protein
MEFFKNVKTIKGISHGGQKRHRTHTSSIKNVKIYSIYKREGFGEARFSKLKVPELQITFSFATLWHLDVPGNRRM